MRLVVMLGPVEGPVSSACGFVGSDRRPMLDGEAETIDDQTGSTHHLLQAVAFWLLWGLFSKVRAFYV